jgi:hypothetical protein
MDKEGRGKKGGNISTAIVASLVVMRMCRSDNFLF